MAEKTLKTRIIQKHDTEANWLLATNFTPMNGEIIIYDEDDNHDYKRIKIGNGTDNVNDLDFVVNKENVSEGVTSWNDLEDKPFYYNKNVLLNKTIENTNYTSNTETIDLVVGEKYNVLFKDMLFRDVVCQEDDEGFKYIQDPNFFHVNDQGGAGLQIAGGVYKTYTIEVYQEELKKLDDLFLEQSDWNNNDEYSGTYIKNRPFYSVEPVYKEVSDEITVEVNTAWYGSNYYVKMTPGLGEKFRLSLLDVCTVVWDGIEYKDIQVQLFRSGRYPMTAIGNNCYETPLFTTYPFSIGYSYNNFNTELWVCAKEAGTHTFQIFLQTVKPELKQIDEHFIPDTIARTTHVDKQLATKANEQHTHVAADITDFQDALDNALISSVQSDWNTNDENDSSYIKNRPFHDIGEENTLYSNITTFGLNDSDTSNIHGILWQKGTLWTLIPALKDVCVVGNTYYITMQEKTYSCECFSYTTENNTEISLLGNRRYFLGTGYDETNEPFLIVNGTEISAILLPNGNDYELKYDNTIELNITIASAPVKPIDRKYLPKGMLLREETYLTGQPGWGKNSEYFNNLTPQAAFGEGSHAEGTSDNPIPETITKTTSIADINSIWYNNLSERFLMAAGKDSHAEGISTLASGDYSHAEGEFAFAQGLGSHAEGGGHAQGKGSHAENLGQAFGNLSHAEGYGSTHAEAAHAEGSGQAEGSHSHAEGENTRTVGRNSHAEGNNTVAYGDHQHVQGMYNIIDYDNKYAHIVGNGYHNNRRNIHTLDWQGNAWFEGNGRFDGAVFSNGAELAKISSIPTKISQLENDSNFVLKETGKGLSTNDYTNEDKQLLADLANVAETGQSDYSINDETHPAFIKNRPVYDIPEIKISTDTWHWGNEPVESENVPGVFASTAMGIVHGKDNSTVEGDLYDVIINGIKYTSPLKKIDNTCVLGNSYIGYIIGSLEIEKTNDTGESYLVSWGAESFDDKDDQIAVIGCINSLANSALNSNVEIYKSQIIKKLDAKFLPNNIGGTQADWNETDETSPSFIKNKPSINADGTVILQSDWNEMNEQSSAYIKNRPFGKVAGEKQSLLPLGEITFSSGESELFNIPENIIIKAGDVIEFQYNGANYNWSILEYMTNIYVAGPGETIQDIMAGNIAIVFDLDGILLDAGVPAWGISLLTYEAETETHVCEVNYIEVNTNTIDPIYIKDLYCDEENKQIILPPTAIPFSKEQTEVWGIPVGSDFVPTSGTTYQVNWNGVNYESQCHDFYHEQLGNFVYIGNLGLMSELLGVDFGISNTGEPYLYAYSPEEQQGILLDLEHSIDLSEVENTVGISSVEKKFQSLKEKYLSILKPVDNEIVYIKETNIQPLGQEDGAFVYMISFNDASCFLGGNPVYITLDNQTFIPDVIDTSVADEWTIIKLDENTGEELFVIGYFEPQNMGILFSKNMVSKIKASSTLVSNVIKEEYLPETVATKDFVLNTVSELNGIILKSSTEGSSKKFKLTIDDDGVLSAEEVTN